MKRNIQPQSINVAINALRFAAKRAGLVFVDEIDALPVDTSDHKHVKPLTLAEGQRLVEACWYGEGAGKRARALRDVAIIMLGVRTGMQRASMCTLEIDDFEVKRKTTLTFVKKGGDKHKILLDPVTLNAVAAWVKWLRLNHVTTGPLFRSLGRSHILDNTPIGDQLTPDGLYRALQQRAERAGLENLSPHVFRRTFVAWAENAGATPAQIAAVTGHKSEDDTTDLVPANFLIPDFMKKTRNKKK